jgi:ribosome biogenesis GTPase
MSALETWGWDDRWVDEFAAGAGAGLVPARVVAQHRGRWLLAAECGEFPGLVTGKFRHDAAIGDLPAVGDWVGCIPVPLRAWTSAAAASQDRPPGRGSDVSFAGDAAQIDVVLPRRTALTRRAAGSRVTMQVVAANVDTLFVATSLNGDLNPRRLERYVAMGRESGAEPVVLLTKADLRDDADAVVADLSAELLVSVVALSGRTGAGLEGVEN